MLAVLGDLHLRADYPWFVEAANHFLDWFETWDINNPDNQLVLVGDLVERPVNGGIVVNFLERMIKTSKFSKIHIVVGNHDVKRIDKVYQLAYEFFKRKSNVTVYSEFTKQTIEGIVCLMFPFLVPTVEILSPTKYYSELKVRGDVLFGHIQDEHSGGDSVKGLKEKAKHICLGHIHNRVHKNYIGSIYPNNHSQNGQRYFRTYERINSSVVSKEYPLPVFLDFKIIQYGEKVVQDEALVSVYVIHGGPAENLMDSKYKDLHIKQYCRATSRETLVKEKVVKKNTKEYFKDFIKQSEFPLNRGTVKICKEALKI